MEKSTKTFDQIVEFSNESYQFLAQANAEGRGETKLCYAIKKLVGNPTTRQKGTLAKAIKGHQRKSADLQVDFASVDERGNLIVTDKGYSYTPENRKKMEAAIDAMVDEIIEFEPYYATEITETLTDYQKELFTGFVIK